MQGYDITYDEDGVENWAPTSGAMPSDGDLIGQALAASSEAEKPWYDIAGEWGKGAAGWLKDGGAKSLADLWKTAKGGGAPSGATAGQGVPVGQSGGSGKLLLLGGLAVAAVLVVVVLARKS